jgi:hypothetical protein
MVLERVPHVAIWDTVLASMRIDVHGTNIRPIAGVVNMY